MKIPKDERLAAILGDRQFMVDYPAIIGQAMGGRDFFFECGAYAMHRVGRALGLGWRIPASKRGTNHVKVTHTGNNKYEIEFLKTELTNDELWSVPVHREIGVHISKLREVYDRETIDVLPA